MNKHTPGPWEHKNLQIRASGFSVAMIGCGRMPPTQALANANLISAAPELLEACKAALEHFRDFHRGEPFVIHGVISDAVAKAEGRVQ